MKLWIKEKSIYISYCTVKRLILSKVFCFCKGGTEMRCLLELNCAGHLPGGLVQEIALMKCDASLLPFVNTSSLIYLFIFLFLTNILPSFKNCTTVLKKDHSKNLRVLYCYLLLDEWEWKTSTAPELWLPVHIPLTWISAVIAATYCPFIKRSSEPSVPAQMNVVTLHDPVHHCNFEI